MGPLQSLRSIKVKLGIVIIAAVAVTALMSVIGFQLGWPIWIRPVIAGMVALVMVQFLAHGMTSPLREMASAAADMARGEYSRRVKVTGVDEVAQLGEAFNAMAAELAEVERQRRELVANVSHELRTPLTALQANLENLVDGVSPPDNDALTVMLHQTERLGRLVHQLLDLSKLESGGYELALVSVDVSELLELAAAEARLHSPGIEVKVDAPPNLTLVADGERLHQVLANLLENAVRFSPPGEPIVIAAAEMDATVELTVTDRGPGIDADEALRVFERFHRADDSRSSSDGGAGLGLAISRWIVELHRGSIRVDQDHPGGRLVVVLPTRGEPTR